MSYEPSFLFLHSRKDFVRLCDVPVRQFLELQGTRVGDKRSFVQRLTRGHKGMTTYLFHFNRVLPKFGLLNACLVMLPELNASVFGFTLSDRL